MQELRALVPQTGRVSAEYCERPVAPGQQTCREAGAFQQWTKKQSDDPVFKAYRREYKKRFAWIRAGRITDEQFYAWSEQAREMKRNATGRSSPWTSSRTGWRSREDKLQKISNGIGCSADPVFFDYVTQILIDL
ncbi:DUF6076 domain-containing protein [Flavonifractor plautii]|nr:DUF6076 domain-containing protein [Flavonifractor plautii]